MEKRKLIRSGNSVGVMLPPALLSVIGVNAKNYKNEVLVVEYNPDIRAITIKKDFSSSSIDEILDDAEQAKVKI